MQNVVIRDYTPDDKEMVERINRKGLGGKGAISRQDLFENELNALHEGKGVCHVAEIEGEVVGFIWMWQDTELLSGMFHEGVNVNDTLYVYAFAVDPPFRGKGVDRMLIADAERTAAEFGRSRILLDIEEDREAIRWFSSNGYVMKSAQIWMVKDLDPED